MLLDSPIAHDTDIVITHGPVANILDPTMKNGKGRNVGHRGCAALFEAVREAQPMVHVFGHNHDGYGVVAKSWNDGKEDTLLDLAGLPQLSDQLPASVAKSIGRQTIVLERGTASNGRRTGHVRIGSPEAPLKTFQDNVNDHSQSTIFVNAALGNQEGDTGIYPNAQKRWGFVMSLALPNMDSSQIESDRKGQAFRVEGEEPHNIKGSKMTPETEKEVETPESITWAPESVRASTGATTPPSPELTPRAKQPIDGDVLSDRVCNVSIESSGPGAMRTAKDSACKNELSIHTPEQDQRPAHLRNLGDHLKQPNKNGKAEATKAEKSASCLESGATTQRTDPLRRALPDSLPGEPPPSQRWAGAGRWGSSNKNRYEHAGSQKTPSQNSAAGIQPTTKPQQSTSTLGPCRQKPYSVLGRATIPEPSAPSDSPASVPPSMNAGKWGGSHPNSYRPARCSLQVERQLSNKKATADCREHRCKNGSWRPVGWL